MPLKIKYILFVLTIHLLIGVLVYEVLREHKLYFFLAEIGIIISLFFSYRMYRSFIRPLEFMASGGNAIRDKDFNVKFVKTGSREMDKLINVYNDMIDNIRQERTTLQEQHYFLEKLIYASPTGIVILDYDDRLSEINPKALDFLSISNEWRNKLFSDFDHPLLNAIAGMEADSSKVIALNGGTERYKCQSSRFIHQGFERKFILIQELSKEILEAEKKAYAKVIRMMAHEVNNSIGAINSILTSLMEFYKMEDPEQDAEVRASLTIALNRNERLNLFMRNFASVIRLPEPFMESVSLQKMLWDIARLMESQAEEKQINIELQLPEKEIFARLDLRQMDQALVNIVINAIESIGEKGSIRFQLMEQPLTILIEDNGPGLSPETSDQLFSPFFSTKMDGQGIGLTLVKEILMNHKAQFSLRTLESGWTRFEILL